MSKSNKKQSNSAQTSTKLLKNLKDQIWRLNNLYTVQTSTGRKPFKMWPVQKHFYENMHTRNIVLKTRQVGFSTFCYLLALDNSLFKMMQCVIMANKKETAAKSLLTKGVKEMWNNMPKEIRKMFEEVENSAYNLSFSPLMNGEPLAHLKGGIQIQTSARGYTYNFGHLSELPQLDKDYPERAEEAVNSLEPAVKPPGTIIIEGTPANGPNGLFADIFKTAWKRGEPKSDRQYKAHFYNWTWDEEIKKMTAEDIKWAYKGGLPKFIKEMQLRHKLTDQQTAYYYSIWDSRRDKKYMAREYPTTVEEAFSSGDDNILGIDPDLVPETPIRTENRERWYEEPLPNALYTIGVDVGGGVGRDSSTICVIRHSPTVLSNDPKVVYCFDCAYTNAEQLAAIAYRVYEEYNGLLCVDSTGYGKGCAERLEALFMGRPGLYRDSKTGRPGVVIGAHNKYAIFESLKDSIRGSLVLSDEMLISESRSYGYKSLSGDKKNTRHSDLLMAAQLATYGRRFYHSRPDIDNETLSRMLYY